LYEKEKVHGHGSALALVGSALGPGVGLVLGPALGPGVGLALGPRLSVGSALVVSAGHAGHGPVGADDVVVVDSDVTKEMPAQRHAAKTMEIGIGVVGGLSGGKTE